MKKIKVKITDLFSYEIDINANNKEDALKKAKEYYENTIDGYVGVADGNSYEETKFKILER